MVYSKKLPPMSQLRRLSTTIDFPAKRGELLRAVRAQKGGADAINFLLYFPADTTFENREDFLTRCEEVELLINEERQTPDEMLNSPQD